MKNRIIKTGVIVAVATLISINIGLLTSNPDHLTFQSTKAQEVNTTYLKYHYLKDVWCVHFDVTFDIKWVQKWWGSDLVLEVEGGLDLNANKKKCKEITQEIYCNIYEATPCLSGGEEGNEEGEEGPA